MMNNVAFNYRKCLGGLLAIGLCLAVASAQAEMFQWDYDGTYYPDNPGAGQDSWTVYDMGDPLMIIVGDPTPGVTHFKDDKTTGDDRRIAMNNAFTGTDFAGDPGGVEWEYRFDMRFTGWTGTDLQEPLFGVRDEGGIGKCAMFAHSQDGTKLFYADPNDQYKPSGVNIWTGDTLIDGSDHIYEAVKYLDGSNVMQVAFYLDGNLEDTRAYSALPDDRYDSNGFGIWSCSPGTSDYYVDDVHFGIIPEPTAAVLLAGLLFVPLLWRRKKAV